VLTAYGHNRQTLLKMTRPESYALDILEEFDALDRAKASRDSESIERHEGNIRRIGRRLEDAMLVRPEDYADSAGEWEARKVQDRLNMPAAERQKQSPFAGMPKLGNTSGQTRDYSKAYDEVMRRAEVFKGIKERWKQRQPVVPGLNVIRNGEFNLDYVAGSEDSPDISVTANIDPDLNTAKLIMGEDFLAKPYPEQKRLMDGIVRDLNKRNLIISGAKPTTYEVEEEDIAFWKRYDPTKIAFDLRLYRDEIMEKARERYGDDVEVTINSDAESVEVTTPQMQADHRDAEQNYDKFSQQQASIEEKMHQKYGWEWFGSMTKQEKDRYEAIQMKVAESENRMMEGAADHLDLGFLFDAAGGRSPDSHRPAGVDYETWARIRAEEQLMRMGKMPRPGEEVDFDDLIPVQQ
jgi:hypothetical protein